MGTADLYFTPAEFSFAPSGLVSIPRTTHALRRGLYSFAASRLACVLERELVLGFQLAGGGFFGSAVLLEPAVSCFAPI